MTQDDIIRMAREAGLVEPYHPYNPWSASQEGLERFASLVAAHEREACAKVCEDDMGWLDNGGGELCAKAIRVRGEK